MMNERKKEVARILLELGCIQLSPSKPFTYASGLEGPIYCDNRKLLSHVAQRKKVLQLFVESISQEGFIFDQFAGLATAGIAHAAFLAERFDMPMIYIRPQAKEHGQKNQIEGDFNSGEKILLVEDLVNQGKSLNAVVSAVKSAGLIPVGCVSIVDYEMEAARKVLYSQNIKLYALTDLSAITEVALTTGRISEKEQKMLINWQKDPVNWQSQG